MAVQHVTYSDPNCSVARSLEIVGERWTLLIVRDAFYGVRRFGDFAQQLGIPRAVLTQRLKLLVEEDILTRHEAKGVVEYGLTEKGHALWPIIRGFMAWGDAHYSSNGARRLVRHVMDAGLVDLDGRCEACGDIVGVTDLLVERGPGFDTAHSAADPISAMIDAPRRLIEPIRGADGALPSA